MKTVNPMGRYRQIAITVIGLLINIAQGTNTENIKVSEEPNILNGTSFIQNNNGSTVSGQLNTEKKFLDNLATEGNCSSPKNAYLKPTILTRIHGFLSCLHGDDRLPENQTGAGVGFSKIFMEIVNPCLIKQGFSENETDNGMMRIESIFDSVSPLLLAPLAQIRNGLLYQDPLRLPQTDERLNVAKLYNSVFLPSSINESSNNVTKAKSETSLKEAILNPFFLRPLIGRNQNRKYENETNINKDHQEFSIKKSTYSTGMSNNNYSHFIIPSTLNPINLPLNTLKLMNKSDLNLKPTPNNYSTDSNFTLKNSNSVLLKN